MSKVITSELATLIANAGVRYMAEKGLSLETTQAYIAGAIEHHASEGTIVEEIELQGGVAYPQLELELPDSIDTTTRDYIRSPR